MKRSDEKLTIIFDIDHVLCDYNLTEEDSILYGIRKSGVLFVLSGVYYILPGVVELMRFLYAQNHMHIVFFSAGTEARNRDFISQLLIKALGEEWYEKIESSLTILSKDQLTPADEDESEVMNKIFGLPYRATKKDISKGLAENCSLKNTVFVDNSSKNVLYGHERNFLQSARGKIPREIEFYAPYRFHQHNSVFYVAGVLAECNRIFKQQKSVTNFLFNLGFEPSPETLFTYVLKVDRGDIYYQRGLKLLRQENPKLTFVSSTDYKRVLEAPQTDEERETIEKICPSEVFGCQIF